MMDQYLIHHLETRGIRLTSSRDRSTGSENYRVFYQGTDIGTFDLPDSITVRSNTIEFIVGSIDKLVAKHETKMMYKKAEEMTD